MTIDEFMENIAPKMQAGYIYQDEHGTWWFDENKPDIICPFGETTPYSWEFQDTRENISFYGLQHVSNWTESLRKVGNKIEDNLVSRVLQQYPELVKSKLKACEIHRDNTKPLNWDCYIKTPICETYPELMRFVKKHCALQAKLDIAVKALKEYAKPRNWYDIELGDEEYFAAQFKNKGYKTAQEALAKIKEIK